MSGDFNWSDLHVMLELSRAGSVTEAADAAGIHQSTMSRRLRAIEARLGGPAFHRHPLAPTEIGLRVLARAERIESELFALQRELEQGEARVGGRVRLATNGEVAMWALAPALPALFGAHPALRLDLRCGDEHVLLSRREADLAVRVGAVGPEGDVVPIRVGEVTLCATRLRGVEAPAWVTLDGTLPFADDAHWVATHAPTDPCVLTSTSTGALLHAVRAGVGRAWLPAPVVAAHPELEAITGLPPGPPSRPVLVVVHRDLRRVQRIRAVIDWVRETFAAF